jgi:hypothetical protein
MRRTGAAGALAAAIAATLALASTATAARPFGPTGPWNSPVSANPTLEPNSGLQVQALANYIKLKANTLHPDHSYPYFQQNTYSTPIYKVGAGAAKREVIVNGTGSHHQLLRSVINAHGGVPFPAGAKPAVGTDGHITVLDTDNKLLYEFWRASSPEKNKLGCTEPLDWGVPCYGDGKWHVEWGGLMDQYDTDPGYFSSSSWPGLTSTQGWNWGGTATSLPLLAGLMTFEDLNSGVIDHALSTNLPDACQAYFSHPAQRRDGKQQDSSCIAEGARLQLDPSYNVEASTAPPLLKAIMRAAQKYGLIVHDITHDNVSMAGQDPITETPDPYRFGPGVGGVPNGNQGYFQGQKAYQVLQAFPWDKLRVIASRHCTAAPCLP